MRKQLTFRGAITGFPAKWRLTNNCKRSILMTCHYPDLGSVCDRPKQISLGVRPIGSTSQLSVVTRHQYGFSVLLPQTLLRGQTSGGVPKRRLFSQPNSPSVGRLYQESWKLNVQRNKVALTFSSSNNSAVAYGLWHHKIRNWHKRETACIMIASGNETCTGTVDTISWIA